MHTPGIEPGSQAWEACMMPLHYVCWWKSSFLINPPLKSVAGKQRPRGPMDKASAYGAGDCRLESCRGHSLLLSDMSAYSESTHDVSNLREDVHVT